MRYEVLNKDDDDASPEAAQRREGEAVRAHIRAVLRRLLTRGGEPDGSDQVRGSSKRS